MELYVARQPVFDESKAIVGYELLHRSSGQRNVYECSDGDFASSNIIASAFLSAGIQPLACGKQAFINFTEDLLRNGIALLLPKDQLVVEILETVAPTEEIISACRELKNQGYTLALDDYVLNPALKPFAALADIIKVDFRQLSAAAQKKAITKNQRAGVRFLAEKVETDGEFQRAAEMGYTFFQGFFFAKPVVLTAQALPVNKLGFIRLMQAVNDPDPNFRTIVSAIECDVSLSVETVRLANSAYYSRKERIASILQAVVALGLEGVRKWVYIAAMRRLNSGKPDILVSTSVIRSKMMELIAQESNQRSKMHEYSLLGLFSLLDVITGCPFDSLLADLNLTDEAKNVLIGEERRSKMGLAYRATLAYERGEWEGAASSSERLGLNLEKLSDAYMDSVRYYNDFYTTERIA